MADLDRDGWPDVALTTGVASVLINDQTGGFTLQQGGANASGGVGLADFDHDGDMDMVASDFNRSLASVLLNDGAAHFEVGTVVPTGYQTGRCTGADFGHDALPEIVTANARAGSVSFVTNTTWTAPVSASILQGTLLAGGVAEAKVSDDGYLVVRNGPIVIRGSPLIERFTADAPTFTPASIVFTLEAKATQGGLVQRIELFDWISGSWVEVDARPATLADQVVNVLLTDPARFVQPGARTMVARVRLDPSGPFGTKTWASLIDRVAWTVR